MKDPSELNDDCMSVLKAFFVLLYDRTYTETTVNMARKHIFTTKGRSMDNLPPTRAALLQHTKRAVYQGGYVWGQALVRCPINPLSRNIRLAKECDAMMATVLNIAARSGGLMF